ncbi:MAG: HDOD domain-containing protein [Bdellovibrionota bacterium]
MTNSTPPKLPPKKKPPSEVAPPLLKPAQQPVAPKIIKPQTANNQIGGGTAPFKVTLSKGSVKSGLVFNDPERKIGNKPLSDAAKALAGKVPGKLGINDERVLEIPPEEKAFAIPGIRDVVMPKIFGDFFDKIVPKLTLPSTSRAILEAFSNIDVTAERVGNVLQNNAYYEYTFFRFLESLLKEQRTMSLEKGIVLVGMQNARNLIIAVQMYRSITGKHPGWDKDQKLVIVPKEILKYAIKTEEFITSSKGQYSDTAYAAGLVFDFLAFIASGIEGLKSRLLDYIELVYKHSLRSAVVAVEVVNTLPNFGFHKYLFSSCLLHDVGKIVMAILDENYLGFIAEQRKHECPRAVRQFIEKEAFGLEHQIFSGLICHYLGVFRPVEKAVTFHHNPFLLRRSNSFQLASMVCLATNIANNFKKTDKADDPVLKAWKGIELRDFNIDLRSVMAVINKLPQI